MYTDITDIGHSINILENFKTIILLHQTNYFKDSLNFS